MSFCMRCHKRGELVEVVNEVRVCKACMFRITEISNFFEHFGWGFNKRLEEIMEVPDTLITAPLLPGSTENNVKKPAKAK